jgi:hypothetical protein
MLIQAIAAAVLAVAAIAVRVISPAAFELVVQIFG